MGTSYPPRDKARDDRWGVSYPPHDKARDDSSGVLYPPREEAREVTSSLIYLRKGLMTFALALCIARTSFRFRDAIRKILRHEFIMLFFTAA